MLQRELARWMGKPQSFASRFESGTVMLEVPQLRQVCQTLGIFLRDELLGTDPVPKEHEQQRNRASYRR